MRHIPVHPSAAVLKEKDKNKTKPSSTGTQQEGLKAHLHWSNSRAHFSGHIFLYIKTAKLCKSFYSIKEKEHYPEYSKYIHMSENYNQ